MSVTLISVSHDTVVSNKHEEQTRHYYVNFQHLIYQNNPQALGMERTLSRAMDWAQTPSFKWHSR